MEDCNQHNYTYKLSIIIPMYNVEKYIANCLDSILSSDLPTDSYEIIIINDGSTDSGPDIVEDYLKQYHNIHYITQENQGQSTARNQGIKVSKGEYIWFIDADDKISQNSSSILKSLSINPQIDILGIKLLDVEEDGTIITESCTQPSLSHDMVMKGRDAIINGYNPSSVCALIAKRDLFLQNDLYFVPGITHQDVELSYRLMAKANHVMFSTLCPYIYIQHPTSVSHTNIAEKRLKYLSDDIRIIRSFQQLSKYYEVSDMELSSVIDQRIKNIQLGLLWGLFQNRKQLKKNGIDKKMLSLLKAEQLFPIKQNYHSMKKKLLATFLNLFFCRR